MTQPEHDRRVDDLRQRLRALGYLDAGVDRFVLAPARGSRSTTAIAWLASLRIGLLAALLLGPAAVIGLAARLPGLVTGTRDAIVIAAYLGILFGAAIAAAAFASSRVMAWIARRFGSGVARYGRALAVSAGAIVTISCLVYLTLWWEAASGIATSRLLWTGFALGVAVAISLLLGHAVTVATLAVVVASGGSADGSRGVPGASWKASLATAVVAFAGAIVLFNATASSEAVPSDQPPLTVVSRGLRLRVIAIDGVDPHVVDALASMGRIPSLAATFGHARAMLGASDPTEPGTVSDPARTWTTISTGQPPERHGVDTLETRRIAGVEGRVTVPDRSPLAQALRTATDLVRLTSPAVASGSERREKTFWEVASDAGLRTVVVNWWATWPASGSGGVVLSDRATLRLEHGGALDGEIAPNELYDRLRPLWPDMRRTTRAQAVAALADAISGPLDARISDILRRSAELDAIQIALATRASDARMDATVVYLPGLDIAQYAVLGGTGSGVQTASAVAAGLEAVRGYYVALDRLLGPILEPAPDEVVAVVTSPGRVTSPAEHLFVIRGQHAREGAQVSGSVTDFAPTLLYALGVPVSRELSGEPLVNLFEPEFVSRYPVRYIARYAPPSEPARIREGRPLDREMIDRLRSLGYLK